MNVTDALTHLLRELDKLPRTDRGFDYQASNWRHVAELRVFGEWADTLMWIIDNQDRLVAALSALPKGAATVAVKPLEWSRNGLYYRAKAATVEYEILDSTPAHERPFQLVIRNVFHEAVSFSYTLEEAKAAAASDNDRCTLSALVATPQPAKSDPVEWQEIEHIHRPATAYTERAYLKAQIAKLGVDAAVVGSLCTSALAAPPQGSFAGYLWAIAEWANSQIAATPQPAVPEGMVEAAAKAIYGCRPFHGLDNRPEPISWEEYAKVNIGLAEDIRAKAKAALSVLLPTAPNGAVRHSTWDEWERSMQAREGKS